MKRIWLLVSVLMVIALLSTSILGCTSNNPTTTTATTTAPATSAAPTTTQVAQKATVLRLAVPWPTGDPVTNNIQNFVDDFNKQAAGKYVIQLHPGESLVKLGDSVDALRTGAVEMAGWPIGFAGNMDPVFNGAEVPFLANNAAADAMMQIKTMPIYADIMAKKFNSKPVFSFTCIALDVIGTKALHTAADWKGTLVHQVSPASGAFIQAMGGNPVSMPFSDGYQGIQKKLIADSMQSSSMMIMFKMDEVAKEFLYGYLIPASLMVSINMDAYNKMPADIQQLLVSTGLKAQTDTNAYFVKMADENAATLKSKGVNIYKLPKAEREVWKTMTQSVVDDIWKQMGAETAAKFKAIADEANAKYPYQE